MVTLLLSSLSQGMEFQARGCYLLTGADALSERETRSGTLAKSKTGFGDRDPCGK
jgi:hypothetical protein